MTLSIKFPISKYLLMFNLYYSVPKSKVIYYFSNDFLYLDSLGIENKLDIFCDFNEFFKNNCYLSTSNFCIAVYILIIIRLLCLLMHLK